MLTLRAPGLVNPTALLHAHGTGNERFMGQNWARGVGERTRDIEGSLLAIDQIKIDWMQIVSVWRILTLASRCGIAMNFCLLRMFGKSSWRENAKPQIAISVWRASIHSWTSSENSIALKCVYWIIKNQIQWSDIMIWRWFWPWLCLLPFLLNQSNICFPKTGRWFSTSFMISWMECVNI